MDADEAKWLSALEERGAEWVKRELQTRTGQPGDPLLDVVFTGTSPSRAFCARWCAEQEDKFGGFSPGFIFAVIVLLIVTIAGTIFSIRDLSNATQGQTGGQMQQR